MKILSASQIRAADQFTIENEPIASIDLMERASNAFVDKFLEIVREGKEVSIFCGIGNNGGDGLAIGRILISQGWDVSIYVIGDIEKGSADFRINLDKCADFHSIGSPEDFPVLDSEGIVIDAIFGSGLSRPIEGMFSELIQYLNNSRGIRISVDVSSGLFIDQSLPAEAIAFKPHHTISFQVPKIVFTMPDCYDFVGEWHVVDIGLDAAFVASLSTPYSFSSEVELRKFFPERSKYAHKSEVGSILLVAGSKGKVGAAALATMAAFRTGAGLVTVRTPSCATSAITSLIPEAMIEEDETETHISSIEPTSATIGIGPGIGTHEDTRRALAEFLSNSDDPLVLDADALNILSLNKTLLGEVPKESILTPHPGEFRRLVGDWKNDFDKLEKLRNLCVTFQINVVLKGAFSAVCDSKGTVHFNPTGNAGMATAGSGDVLTGIITALVAQRLKPTEALKLGVYIHGRAGDFAAEELGENSVMASDIISNISNALKEICV